MPAVLMTELSLKRTFSPRSLPVRRAGIVFCLGLLAGCGSQSAPPNPSTDLDVSIPVVESTEDTSREFISAADMRKRLGANDQAQFERKGRGFTTALLGGTGIESVEALRGQPLQMLDLSQTRVTDLSPLQGMALKRLMLVDTPVSDLSPLAGMPLELLDASGTQVSDLMVCAGLTRLRELYLENAKVDQIAPLAELRLTKLWINKCEVTDLSPLNGRRLQELNLCETPITDLEFMRTLQVGTLWVRETAVTDLSPLIGQQELTSLDVQGCPVTDIAPLAQLTTLQRLNISETDVADVSPLATLPLTRLILTPGRVQQGMEAIRAMGSLRELDTSFDGVATALSPSEFWERYDRGDFNSKTTD